MCLNIIDMKSITLQLMLTEGLHTILMSQTSRESLAILTPNVRLRAMIKALESYFPYG
jgi:hypothetical protein